MRSRKIRLLVMLLILIIATAGLVQVAYTDAAETKEGKGQSLQEKATDPTSILTQFQLQNVFIPSTYDADGYSNQFILQAVSPMKTGWDLFPTQIIRPTLPLNVLIADPD